MKTLKEFDYDLWAVEENDKKRYFVRVKATGEETEVSLEVMRLLMKEEKRLRRKKEKERHNGEPLSLDIINTEEDVGESSWLFDNSVNVEETALMKVFQDEFCKVLTPNQTNVFETCMIGGVGIRKYARLNNLDHKSVHETVEAIRKKFRNFYF